VGPRSLAEDPHRAEGLSTFAWLLVFVPGSWTLAHTTGQHSVRTVGMATAATWFEGVLLLSIDALLGRTFYFV
jgi:hypothetical protein